MKALIFILSLFTINFSLYASDHIDGVPTIADGQADLTDLYAFPTPGKSDNLTVILNSYSGVTPLGHFSSKVDYEIEIRPIQKNVAPENVGFRVFAMDAVKLKCQFTDPNHHAAIKEGKLGDPGDVSCQLFLENNQVDQVSGKVKEVLSSKSIKLFTGPRTDAFFLSFKHFQGVINRKGFAPSPVGSVDNLMHTVNVLTIAVEIDLKAYALDPWLVGVSGQSFAAENGTYVDRVGRPEITNFSMHDFSGENPLKRKYNQKAHFGVSQAFKKSFQERLIDNISAYDLLDKKQDWSEKGLEEFTDILVNDYLVVDMKGVCTPGVNEYLAIEKAMLLGLESNSCGGRRLEDDIMATLTGYYLAGLEANLADYINGVVAPYQGNSKKSLQSEFPYLDRPGITSIKMATLLAISKSMQE